MSAAPHVVLWPSYATGTPLMVWFGSPSAMVQPPWPRLGQLHASPLRATAMPPTVKCGAPLAVTLPPWSVGSPRRMILLVIAQASSVGGVTPPSGGTAVPAAAALGAPVAPPSWGAAWATFAAG